MSNYRDHAFLETVRQALSDVIPNRNKDILSPNPPKEMEQRLEAFSQKSVEGKFKLLAQLEESAASINVSLTRVKTAKDAGRFILELIKEKTPEYGSKKKVAAWHHPLIEGLELDEALAGQGIPFIVPSIKTDSNSKEDRDQFRQEIIESFVGITSADYCVAQSATLTMKCRPGQPKSVSLVPLIHVAVIELDQLLENLEEFYFRLRWDPEEQELGLTNCMTFISGPSKTGDIELVMVHGAHGPRELHLYVITGGEQNLSN